MLFRRREQPPWSERIRIWLWPRHSWSRSFRYFGKRVLRLSASPHVIAIGFAIGIFASFTPFVGLHVILSFVIAYLLGGNMLAAALGTSIGNPIMFPIIWVSTYNLGELILGRTPQEFDTSVISEGIFTSSFDSLVPILKPMLVGSIPLGLAMAGVIYFIVRAAARSYQSGRRERLAERAQDMKNRQESLQ